MGGDLTGKAVIPVAEQPDGSYLAFQHGKEVTLNSLEEVEDFSKRAGNMGFYPTIVTEAEYQALSADPDAQHELFKKLVADRVQGMLRDLGRAPVRYLADRLPTRQRPSEVGLGRRRPSVSGSVAVIRQA